MLGAHLLPKGIQAESLTSYLLAGNGTKIPLLGELKVTFEVADHEHAVLVSVTEAVDKFVLHINLLSEQRCQWDFSQSCILLGEDWVPLRKPSAATECHYVYVCQNYRLPSGIQAEVPVLVILPNLQTDSEPY